VPQLARERALRAAARGMTRDRARAIDRLAQLLVELDLDEHLLRHRHQRPREPRRDVAGTSQLGARDLARAALVVGHYFFCS